MLQQGASAIDTLATANVLAGTVYKVVYCPAMVKSAGVPKTPDAIAILLYDNK